MLPLTCLIGSEVGLRALLYPSQLDCISVCDCCSVRPGECLLQAFDLLTLAAVCFGGLPWTSSYSCRASAEIRFFWDADEVGWVRQGSSLHDFDARLHLERETMFRDLPVGEA